MGHVGSVSYKLLPPCPTIRVLSYRNCQRSNHSISKWIFRNLALQGLNVKIWSTSDVAAAIFLKISTQQDCSITGRSRSNHTTQTDPDPFTLQVLWQIHRYEQIQDNYIQEHGSLPRTGTWAKSRYLFISVDSYTISNTNHACYHDNVTLCHRFFASGTCSRKKCNSRRQFGMKSCFYYTFTLHIWARRTDL